MHSNGISSLFKIGFLALAAMVLVAGCKTVGPDFETPEAPVVEDWTDDNPVISRDTIELSEWWTVFNDPVLNELVEQGVLGRGFEFQ